MLRLTELFDLSRTLAGDFLKSFDFPWLAVPHIKEFILSLQRTLGGEYVEVSTCVYVHRSAIIAPSAYLGAPCIIGADTEVRQGAFIRGSALIGDNCVVGNSAELKNVVLFDGVQAPHYNYLGDSILGYKAHFGAGAITSNVKSDKSLVDVCLGGERISTGQKKFGALVGDFSEIGCNSVLNPGTVIGRNTNVYPLSSVRGYVPPDSIYKNGGVVVTKN